MRSVICQFLYSGPWKWTQSHQTFFYFPHYEKCQRSTFIFPSCQTAVPEIIQRFKHKRKKVCKFLFCGCHLGSFFAVICNWDVIWDTSSLSRKHHNLGIKMCFLLNSEWFMPFRVVVGHIVSPCIDSSSFCRCYLRRMRNPLKVVNKSYGFGKWGLATL